MPRLPASPAVGRAGRPAVAPLRLFARPLLWTAFLAELCATRSAAAAFVNLVT